MQIEPSSVLKILAVNQSRWAFKGVINNEFGQQIAFYTVKGFGSPRVCHYPNGVVFSPSRN